MLAEQRSYVDAKAMRDELGKTVVEDLTAQYAFENAESVFRYTEIGNNAGQKVVAARDQSRDDKEKYLLSSVKENTRSLYIEERKSLFTQKTP